MQYKIVQYNTVQQHTKTKFNNAIQDNTTIQYSATISKTQYSATQGNAM